MNAIQSKFKSVLAKYICQAIQEKLSCGYAYEKGIEIFLRLDQFLVEKNHKRISFPKEIVDLWCRRRDSEAPRTQLTRITAARTLSRFLILRNIPAYYPLPYSLKNPIEHFIPYIFSHHEISRMIKSADELKNSRRRSKYLRSFPIILRLLYSTGMRRGEATRLRWKDVDLKQGILKIHQSKFRKDRFVPLSEMMTDHLKKHALQREFFLEEPVFSRMGKPFAKGAMYWCFRQVLLHAGIPHQGKGAGPRIHDLRHTFAVHNLEKWLKAKEDLDTKLSVLSDYLGHDSLNGTQTYLRLMPSIFPEIATRAENSIGQLIKKYKHETN